VATAPVVHQLQVTDLLEVLRVPDSSMVPLASLAPASTDQSSIRPSGLTPGNATTSEDGSGDEGATIHVDSPLIANGSSQSSPVKKEKD
jgi:hypothetical protein